MKPKNRSKFNGSHDLRAKLSFDQGFAEKPIHVIKGNTTEKTKGVSMIQLIKLNFGLSDFDIKERLRFLDEEAMTPTIVSKKLNQEQFKFPRDEKGNIISPFRSKKKLY